MQPYFSVFIRQASEGKEVRSGRRALASVASVSVGGLGAKNEERESKTTRKMAQVKERGGGGEKGSQYCSTSLANQALRSLANVGFQNRGVCLQAFPSFPSPSPLFHFLALVSFLARPKPEIPFLSLSLLQN